MIYLILKYAVTAFIVVLVSEIARRNDRFGAVLAALPLVTVMTLIWLKAENSSAEKISNHAYYTFWYVIPTLPMFLLFPKLMRLFDFWIALGISSLFTVFFFFLFAYVLGKVGIHLL